jgi:hypothetical protein
MTLYGKIIVLALSLFSFVGCSVDSSTELKQQSTASLSDEEKKVLKSLLDLVFLDPETGTQPTDSYQAYLSYLDERFALALKLASASSEGEKRIMASRLNRLDRDFAIENAEIKQTMDRLSIFKSRIYQDKNTFERIKSKYSEDFKRWDDARNEIVEEAKSEPDDELKKLILSKMLRLDDQFKTRFLWFVAN